MAISTGDKSIAFLATQGNIWDTQWDMLTALIGTLISLLFLSRINDNSIAKLSLNQTSRGA